MFCVGLEVAEVWVLVWIHGLVNFEGLVASFCRLYWCCLVERVCRNFRFVDSWVCLWAVVGLHVGFWVVLCCCLFVVLVLVCGFMLIVLL